MSNPALSLNYLEITDYAESAMRQQDWQEALTRWAVVREKFPGREAGYTGAARAYLELQDFTRAEISCTQGMEHVPQAFWSLYWYAESAMRQQDWQEALTRWAVVRKKFPGREAGYNGAARAYLELQDFTQAEIFCTQGMEHAPQAFWSLYWYAESAMRQQDWQQALTRWAVVREKFPGHEAGYNGAARAYLELQDFTRAEISCTQGMEHAPQAFGPLRWYAESAMRQRHWQQALKRWAVVREKFPGREAGYNGAARAYRELQDLVHLKELYELALRKMPTTPGPWNNYLKNYSRPKNKIAFCGGKFSLSFFSSVIKRIGNIHIDIITVGKISEEFIEELQLNGFCIYCDIHNLLDYEFVIVDSYYMKYINLTKCKIISFYHSVDGYMDIKQYQKMSMFIYSSQKQCNLKELYPYTDILKNNVNYNNICEIAYTGPYHMDEYLETSKLPKQLLRKKLLSDLGIEISCNKPVVFCLEDGLTHLGQIVYMLNNISNFCTVIFKPIYRDIGNKGNKIIYKLNKNIIIIKSDGKVPNLLKANADVILAGFDSGTFVSSVMCGLNCIPYFSRFVKFKYIGFINPTLQPYYDWIPNSYDKCNCAGNILLYKFNMLNMLFDVLDTNKIKDAILGTEYRDWYYKNLPSLQKEVFGDYILEGAAEKTANYIMKFVREGTLGKDCLAVYLKEQSFKQQ